ncbi:P-loop containing nucleoside triphosphate hydrolase protein [Xylariaceae sp. FL1019]|nr:P-loop containing nucleoside triphosphate hydrolase protein [Xylariaceae sp. FL1019]
MLLHNIRPAFRRLSLRPVPPLQHGLTTTTPRLNTPRLKIIDFKGHKENSLNPKKRQKLTYGQNKPYRRLDLDAFVPRETFEVSDSLKRSYFLGHHRAALTKMASMLSNISLIIECRDSRIPLTSTNPLLESALSGRDRIIVYTKQDLTHTSVSAKRSYKTSLSHFHATSSALGAGNNGAGKTSILYTSVEKKKGIEYLLDEIKRRCVEHDSILGMRALVVGMPNAGKSTLLNALRKQGIDKGEDAKKKNIVARTGSNPGITRKLGTPVRVVERTVHEPRSSHIPPAPPGDGSEIETDTQEDIPKKGKKEEQDYGEGVLLIDTPGVFIPYVSSVESMLKLCLVGCVRDNTIPFTILADYLLFRLNRLKLTRSYSSYSRPTNSVDDFLAGVAKRTGKLGKGGVPDLERAAEWIVTQWRGGKVAKFALDDVSERGVRAWRDRVESEERSGKMSLNAARRKEKDDRRERNAMKQARKRGGDAGI